MSSKIRIKNTETRKLIRALDKYGLEMRFNGAHFVISCPEGKSIVSIKKYHFDRQWNELKKLGVDMDKLKELL